MCRNTCLNESCMFSIGTKAQVWCSVLVPTRSAGYLLVVYGVLNIHNSVTACGVCITRFIFMYTDSIVLLYIGLDFVSWLLEVIHKHHYIIDYDLRHHGGRKVDRDVPLHRVVHLCLVSEGSGFEAHSFTVFFLVRYKFHILLVWAKSC